MKSIDLLRAYTSRRLREPGMPIVVPTILGAGVILTVGTVILLFWYWVPGFIPWLLPITFFSWVLGILILLVVGDE